MNKSTLKVDIPIFFNMKALLLYYFWNSIMLHNAKFWKTKYFIRHLFFNNIQDYFFLSQLHFHISFNKKFANLYLCKPTKPKYYIFFKFANRAEIKMVFIRDFFFLYFCNFFSNIRNNLTCSFK